MNQSLSISALRNYPDYSAPSFSLVAQPNTTPTCLMQLLDNQVSTSHQQGRVADTTDKE